MNFRPRSLGSALLSVDYLFVGVWTLVLIVALVLQAFPIFVLVMMIALTFGVPAGAALTLVPVIFVALLYLSCLIASKFTKRSDAKSKPARPVPARPGATFRTVPRIAQRPQGMNPAELYRHMRPLG